MNDRTISWYDEHAEGLASRYDQADAESLHSLLRKWIPSGSSVLEIGCGSGRDARFLASMECSVTATDGSDAMLQAARQNLRKKAERNVSFEPALFPLPAGHPLLRRTFDAITAIAVLMHISDSDLFTFASQVKILLKDQGIFFCSFSFGERKEKDDRFFENRTPEEVQHLFEQSGFRLLARVETKDGLGRDILWMTMVFSLRENELSDPYGEECHGLLKKLPRRPAGQTVKTRMNSQGPDEIHRFPVFFQPFVILRSGRGCGKVAVVEKVGKLDGPGNVVGCRPEDEKP
jgi:SAM-dependent methyltransferase